MAKRKDIGNAALKALLAGAETSALIKIPVTFISELASLPDDKQNALAKCTQEQFNELLTQSELATINAASAAADAKEIKKDVKKLIAKLDEQNAKQIYIDRPDIDSNHEDAATLINEGEPKAALALLELLWKRHNDKMSDRQKWNTKRLIGCAYDRQAKSEEAGRYFLEAKGYDPDHERARAFEALGHLCMGNRNKAHKLANKVLEQYDHEEVAWSVWIRTAPTNISFVEIESHVPKHLHANTDIAFALAEVAVTKGKYDVAEKYMLAVEGQLPGNPRITENLGTLMYRRANLNEHFLYARSPTSEEYEFLIRAEDLLSTSLKLWMKEGLISGISGVRRKLALVYGSLGKNRKSKDEIRVAYELDTTDPESIYRYALSISEDNIDNAISLLEALTQNKKYSNVIFLLCQMLYSRNGEGDLVKASEYLLDNIGAIKEEILDFRVDYLILLVEISANIYGPEESLNLLIKMDENLTSEIANIVIRSRIMKLCGKIDEAKQLALEAIESVNEATSFEDKRRVALILQSLDLSNEALTLWKGIVKPDYIGVGTPYN